MNEYEIQTLVERDPEAAADAFYRSMGGGQVNDAPETDWNALLSKTPLRRSHAWRVVAFMGRCVRFAIYCALTFLRPVVMLGTGLMALLFGVGAAVMYFIYQKGLWPCLGVAGAGVVCVAIRELYDELVMRLAPREPGVFSD